MHGVAALLAAAAAAYVAARILRTSPAPLLLVAGVILSVVAEPPGEVLEAALVLGAAFVLFVVGLELDPRRLRAQRRAASRVALAQFVGLAMLGFVAAAALGLDLVEAGWVALALPASSTLVGVCLLQRRRQMF
ncbi:MAG TPA: cation:proton antiporter, partial [Longimicrobiales bacterium]|nr:cation:proton antiporter [Longimicrobiales bacterium]